MTGLVSAFLRTACCDAPAVQGYVFDMDAYPVWCSACLRQVATPGGEDIWRLDIEASIERMFYNPTKA